MKIPYFLMMLSALSSVFAFNWQSGANNVQWATGCDFYGGDLYPVASTGENCGGNCVNVALCTHFTYFQGTCYLKHFDNVATATNLNGGVCGWVNRTSNNNNNSIYNNFNSQ